jgi:hypothetical protein
MKVIKDIYYSSNKSENHNLDIYMPDCNSFPVYIYFHGGGIESGSKDIGEQIPKEIAEAGICFVSVNYRMYPDAKYPEFNEDCAEAVNWVNKNIHKYGNVTNIYIGGSSAGGYLSMMLCFDEKYLGKYNLKPTDFKGYILDAGQPTVHFNVLRERGIDSRRIIVDEAAPIYHVCEKEYPNMLIIVSDNDMENRYEQTMLLQSTFRHFKVDESKYEFICMKDSKHCSYLWKNNEIGKNMFATMCINFIQKLEYDEQEC